MQISGSCRNVATDTRFISLKALTFYFTQGVLDVFYIRTDWWHLATENGIWFR